MPGIFRRRDAWDSGFLDRERPPIVTIFGAGIAGLTAAHELVERGFAVQVVERFGTGDEEYEVEIGGMAKNQGGRLTELPERLFPFYFDAASHPLAQRYQAALGASWIVDPDAALAQPTTPEKQNWLQRTHTQTEQAVPRLFKIPHRFRTPTLPAALVTKLEADQLLTGPELDSISWNTEILAEGVSNEQKIDEVLGRLLRAHAEYDAFVKERQIAFPIGGVFDGVERNRILRRLTLVMEVHGCRDPNAASPESRNEAMARARLVRQRLLVNNQALLNPIPDLDTHLVVIAPDIQDISFPLEADEVVIRTLGPELPTDHGYRFFPSHYRHLFDTMRRTPILDPGTDEGRTTFDQLRPTPSVDLAFEDGDDPKSIPRKRARSLEDLRSSLRVLMEDLGLSGRDMLRWDVRMLKFMTSCGRRRRDEYEDESWWKFIGGEVPPDQNGYSPRAAGYILKTPQALLGVPADEIDARSHGNVSVQLLLDHMEPGGNADMTLIGPTSSAWLRHWKTYLKEQGVRFFMGRLTGLAEQALHGLVPVVEGPHGRAGKLPVSEDGHDYVIAGDFTWPSFYVVALSYPAAAQIVQDANTAGLDLGPEGSDLLKLIAFDDAAQSPRGDNQRHPSGHVEEGKPLDTNPLRDLSGVQFFFLNQVRIGKGHVYYPDATWGLSSISQLAYWHKRPNPGADFLGQVSVDVGDYHALRPGHTKTAWHSTRFEIARGIWGQVTDGLHRIRRNLAPRARYFYIDAGIRFGAGADGTPVANRMPYLVPLAGQWKLRPGLYTPSPEMRRVGHGRPGHTSPRGEVGIGTEIFYTLARHRWVLAGAYVATHSRVTTMESACESGRHAVNTILHALMLADPRRILYDSQNEMLGELCDIWDPEEHELPDLRPLKRLDDALYEEGLPHFLDILRVVEAADRGSEIVALSGHSARVVARDWEFAGGIFEQLLAPLVGSAGGGGELERLLSIVQSITKKP